MLDWIRVNQSENCYTFDLRIEDTINLTALEAAHFTINYIVNNYPPPYTLYLSGGIDSQAMLYSWITSGKPFSTLSAVYNDNLNSEDLLTLKQFSDLHGTKINYIDFNVIDFLENEHHEYAMKYLCGSPHITSYMKLLSLTTEGTSIMSGEFIQVGRTGLDKNQLGLYHYGKLSKQNIIPFFFLETKELAYSFTVRKVLPRYKKLQLPIGMQQEINKTTRLYDLKVSTYNENGFPVLRQGYYKHTGFEKIKMYYDNPDNCKKQLFPKHRLEKLHTQKSNRNFDLLFRNKYEAIMAKYKYTILSNDKVLKYA